MSNDVCEQCGEAWECPDCGGEMIHHDPLFGYAWCARVYWEQGPCPPVLLTKKFDQT